MEHLIPTEFRELLSALTFLMGFIFSFLSLLKNGRDHALRMAGPFLLVSLALFANNAYSYFATLFIVGTAVTQLEFLQNIAAIIRGSKEYFDYQKEYLSQREIESSIEKEVKEIEAAKPEEGENISQKVINLSIDKSNITSLQFSLLVEEHTFKFLEKKYGKPVLRHVRYKGKNALAEFDGVMQMDGTDLVFEIKSSRRHLIPTHYILDSAQRLIKGSPRVSGNN